MYHYVLATLIALTATLTSAFAQDKLELKWKGDIRYRHEQFDLDQSVAGAGNKTDYSINQIYFRLGGLANITSATSLEFRVASGPGRTTTLVTLGDSNRAFQNISFNIDRAFIDWHGVEGLSAVIGRVANRLWAPGWSNLVWDSDLNFDQAGVKYEAPLAGATVFAQTSYNFVSESNLSNRDDVNLIIGQVGLKDTKGGFGYGLAAAYYHYTNMPGTLVFATTPAPSGSGNTTVGSGADLAYAYDYNILNLSAELTNRALIGRPITLYGDVGRNVAISGQTDAWLAGILFGELKKQGDWLVAYDFRRIEADALVGAFVDSTAIGSRTDARSHRVSGSYQLSPALAATAYTVLVDQDIGPGGAEAKRNRVGLELIAAF